MFNCFLLGILPFVVLCHNQRMLLGDETLEARLQVLETTVQDLKSEVAQKNNYITQLQSHVLNLQSTLSQLEHTVNTPKQGCQVGSHILYPNSTQIHAQSAYVSFNPPFSEVPKVVWGTSSLDVDHNHNIRFATSITGITTKGFTVAESTWGDTGLYYVSLQWMACPAHY